MTQYRSFIGLPSQPVWWWQRHLKTRIILRDTKSVLRQGFCLKTHHSNFLVHFDGFSGRRVGLKHKAPYFFLENKCRNPKEIYFRPKCKVSQSTALMSHVPDLCVALSCQPSTSVYEKAQSTNFPRINLIAHADIFAVIKGTRDKF